MVQTKRIVDGCSKYHRSNDYPKLGVPYKITVAQARQKLKNRNFFCPKTIKNKARIMYLLQRSERGLMSYENPKYKDSDLLKFIRRRGLAKPAHRGRTTRAAMVKTLEEADDADGTFIKFAQLPAELRNRVYELHFKSLELPSHPEPAPIVMCSRKICHETHALFYSKSTFVIVIGQQKSVNNTGTTYYLDFDSATRRFLAEAKPWNFDRIKTLEVQLPRRAWVRDGKILDEHMLQSWKLDLQAGTVEGKRYDVDGNVVLRYQVVDRDVLDPITAQLQPIVAAIAIQTRSLASDINSLAHEPTRATYTSVLLPHVATLRQVFVNLSSQQVDVWRWSWN